MQGDDFITRKIPECPPRPEESNSHPDFNKEKYTIEVITPLFGGGVEAGKVDPSMPIRPSSIRGHLRFWWRATRGARCSDVKNLRERESEIWGSTENPSPVIIEVVQPERDTLEPRSHPHHGFQRSGAEAYILFSAKENNLCKEGFTFELRMYWPKPEALQQLRDTENAELKRLKKKTKPEKIEDIGPDVEMALWAWVNFGGIGARTRRGCGALYCKKLASPDRDSIGIWYITCLKKHGIHISTSREWPVMPEKILIKPNTNNNVLESWEKSISTMKEFRQGRDIGRDRGTGNHPGRSRWPEAETLRTQIYGSETRPKGIHSTDSRMKGIHAFPRIEFGMPIILEIRGESIKSTLQPSAENDRMASPLILRPLKFADGKCASMIIRLNTPQLTSAFVKPGANDLRKGHPIKSSDIVSSNNQNYRDSPMKGRCNTGSALDAFLTFAKEPKNGFMEVPE